MRFRATRFARDLRKRLEHPVEIESLELLYLFFCIIRHKTASHFCWKFFNNTLFASACRPSRQFYRPSSPQDRPALSGNILFKQGAITARFFSSIKYLVGSFHNLPEVILVSKPDNTKAACNVCAT